MRDAHFVADKPLSSYAREARLAGPARRHKPEAPFGAAEAVIKRQLAKAIHAGHCEIAHPKGARYHLNVHIKLLVATLCAPVQSSVRSAPS
ncbi:hypothetical protein ACSFBX_34705 [Variovorax sp. RB2P76]|uniref:hypothetical protein n=1 Tax=unclassified Variovorax TaxID=663243 RepID=UPI003F4830DB